MKKIKFLSFTLFMVFVSSTFAQTDKEIRIMEDAERMKTEMLDRAEGLQEYFSKSAGYAIFPNVGKGGLIIGGASGNGVLYDNGTAVGMANLKELSVGFKAGGKAVAEVIFFESETDLEAFKNGSFELGAEASAIAIKKGVSVNLKFTDGTAVFAMPKTGLMADASVAGQKFKYAPFQGEENMGK
ncbi:YSC84-related protein [Maribacter sp. 2-571]|uniref:lipid-binding SYLF domain-containing protein n=1 Tax=Maribacter sp. 2-571 TaxID=3417569 RepID=UPI003D32CC4B